MARILIEDITANEDQWLAQKFKTIGSGDIASICGVGFMTPLELWAVKTGREKPPAETLRMWWGREIETSVGRLCSKKLGVPVRKNQCLYGHESIPWGTATPDFFADFPTEPAIVEVKNINANYQAWKEDTPLPPRLQVIWQLGVCGLSSGMVAPLCGGDVDGFTPRGVEYDERLFGQVFELADRFWNHVANDSPPAPTGEDRRLVERLIGEISDIDTILPHDMMDTCKAYEQANTALSVANANIKTLENERDRLRALIRIAMGKASRAVCGPYIVNVSEVNVREKVTSAYSYQRFSIKEKKQDGDGTTKAKT